MAIFEKKDVALVDHVVGQFATMQEKLERGIDQIETIQDQKTADIIAKRVEFRRIEAEHEAEMNQLESKKHEGQKLWDKLDEFLK
jgi:hypothetical protein